MGSHEHSCGHATRELIYNLEMSTAVRSFGSVDTYGFYRHPFNLAVAQIRQGKVNTIFFDPSSVDRRTADSVAFIDDIRTQWPNVVFVLYRYAGIIDQEWNRWLEENPRFAHYFYIGFDESNYELFDADFASVIRSCQQWHFSRYDFDVVVSFAGRDRDFARAFSDELVKLGARVFYDEYFRHELLGKDLYVYLHEAYSKRARYCVALLSEAYLETVWAQHELRSAQERALRQNRIEYLLPLRLEPISVPGLMSTTGFLDVTTDGAPHAARIVAAKLWPTSDLALAVSGLSEIPKIHIDPYQP